ncbi:MAG: outer membrane protein assembly factor BamA [Rhodospirillales bacterium CG15_BIG_FIL_POST_REV_8_21_14_020_66_15]|nr:MAG: outer membrane protein assembly factor BamA [Rhodospirillales bacterium CG15_BIG_FIL_POST_REV_8_21_14_020_66_15]
MHVWGKKLERLSRLLVGITVIAAIWAASPAVLAQGRGAISEIVVEGAQRIEPGTVRSYLLIKEGEAADPVRINQSLKSLFATGLFADVTMRQDGSRLIVNVVENPIINRVAFEGNKKVEDTTLEAEVTLRPRVIFTRAKVQSDLQRILSVYRATGRFGATVEPKVIRLPQNRIDLVFEISEGQPTKVARISFIGNEYFDDDDLRENIRTQETVWYRFLSSDDSYDPDRLTLDRELLRRFYLRNGFADFRVQSAVAELTRDRKNFFITFSVQEGKRYRFGKVDVATTIRNLDVDSIRKRVKIDQGDWYDASLVDETIDALTEAVGEKGFAFVEVRPRLDRDRDKRTIDVVFEINEGPRVFVERINIVGNMRTKDDVIRREFRLVEGDAFNSAKLRRSRQRIQNLDFFETVEMEPVPGSAPDKAVINVTVTEKSTGSISIGAGFSTDQGVLGDIGLRERNLLGTGRDLALRFVLAARRSEIDLKFTEPFFLNRDITAGVDLFRISEDLQDFGSFDKKRTGFRLRAGYHITELLTQNWSYEVRSESIEDVASDASLVVQDAAGTNLFSTVEHGISYDTRDSRLTPTKGYFARLATSVSGLGGDVYSVKNVATGSYNWTPTEGFLVTVGGKAGYVVALSDDVLLSERFFVGGRDLRGFAAGGVGPRDISTDDSLGGEWMYTGSLELGFPLGLPQELGVSGRLFTDFGSAGELATNRSNIEDTGSLRASVGLGLTWKSPFGPLGLDLGIPVVKESFDETELVRVNFGTRF